MSAVLTIKSGLDSHMIVELEDDLNCCYLLMLLLIIYFILFEGFWYVLALS
jgi:hypothetical protein